MINCVFYSIFFALFLNVSLESLKFSQINRNFLSIYKGMFEACIVTIDIDGEPIVPYYNKDKIEKYIVSYLEKNISRYSKEFTLSTKYYNENFDYETNEYIRGISIKLDAKINYFYDYEKEQRFSIKARENYE